MRELNYESQGTNTYLVYEVKDSDILDNMSLGMLTNNKINGIAQTIFTQRDTKQYIMFNVSAKVSVAQFFAGAVNKKRLLEVFKGIADAILAAEDYMLDINNIVLHEDYIFVDVSSRETALICMPFVNAEAYEYDLKTFFRNLLFHTQFDQTENCDYVAKLINYLNSISVFSAADFGNLADALLNERHGSESFQHLEEMPSQEIQKQTESSKVTQQPVVSPAKEIKQAELQKTIKQLENNKSQMNLPKPQIKPQPKQDRFIRPENKTIESNAVEGQKRMTMLGLLRNFSKENVALYKAQKDAQKSAPKEEKTKKKESRKNTAFAIPGQQQEYASVPQIPSQDAVQQEVIQQTVQPPASRLYSQQIPQNFSQGRANFGETTVLNAGMGETTVLSDAMLEQQTAKVPYLLRIKNNEKVAVDKPVFRIGKEKSYVDYFIGDNTAISRSHADIITRDGYYYIRDNNSTNHTYMNGTLIPSNEEILINVGTKLRLANEDFEFLS